ncbi:F0F1 ATP synthase subunit B [Buchnera aphidicola]|uniref:F0F1 ATP synthase subunit B n=1 Tax=Buchnera aphidicola TaxID=9 RepID=UPI0034643DB4
MNLNATIFGQVISFILFVWFCMKYIWPPILLSIETRQREIHESLLRAHEAQKELQLVQETINQKIKETKDKASKIINEANKQKALIIEEAHNKATEESKKIFIKMQTEIDIKMIDAREILQEETVELAVAIAEKIIKEHIPRNINLDLTDSLINSLSKVKNLC